MGENDYDALRQKNITDRNAIFADFFNDLKKQTSELKEADEKRGANDDSENQPPKKRRRTIAEGNLDTFRAKNLRFDVQRKYNTRSRAKNTTENKIHVLQGVNANKSQLRVLFPWAKPFQRSIDLMKVGVCDVDEEEEEEKLWKVEEEEEEEDYFEDVVERRSFKATKPYDPSTIPSVDEITEKMLKNVATRSSTKTYSKIAGTSCHQCRQKTLDTKTVCRSGQCIGVRGQFCGPCLRGRYGENAVEVLKDPNWACPPCRGLCNCSICRTRNGLRPTGILAPVAQEEGFSSVLDYLQCTETDET